MQLGRTATNKLISAGLLVGSWTYRECRKPDQLPYDAQRKIAGSFWKGQTYQPLQILYPGFALGLERRRQTGKSEVWQELKC